MAMTHSSAGNEGESIGPGTSQAAVRTSDDVPPSSAPFGAPVAGALKTLAGNGQEPG
jgi:hypothetical protein